MGAPALASVCLRLPKVYGRENNRFETVYRFAKYPHWRWTLGHVENFAAAIMLALLHPSAVTRSRVLSLRLEPTRRHMKVLLEIISRSPPAG
jgi:hypothetical protein